MAEPQSAFAKYHAEQSTMKKSAKSKKSGQKKNKNLNSMNGRDINKKKLYSEINLTREDIKINKPKSRDLNKKQKSIAAKNTKLFKRVEPELGLFNGLGLNNSVMSLQSNSSGNLRQISPIYTASSEQGENMLEWIIYPCDIDTFNKKYWEKRPLHIERNNADFYSSIVSGSVLDEIMRTQNVMFSINLDITSYEDGKRSTHNPIGRALPHVVWDFYSNGCSVRLLNPQSFIPKMHLLNATLQDHFNCFVGANIYLTPPNSQGFAPHYDDIEALILQIEGKKLWRIYNPLNKNEELPRYSSPDYSQEDIGEPIMEITLSAGDFLYFPRGFIHQAVTVEGEHSLHVTLSTYQKHTWGDLIEKVLPETLKSAMQNDVEFREGLPLDLFSNMGFTHSDSDAPKRTEYIDHLKRLFNKLCDRLAADAGADQMSKEFIHSALPPIVSEREMTLTTFGNSRTFTNDGSIANKIDIQLSTEVRLLRANIMRLIPEENTFRIYHIMENSNVYRENEIQHLEIDEIMVPAIDGLIKSYPAYIKVGDLDLEDDDDKIQIVTDLWEKGLLMTKVPLMEGN